MMRTEINAEQIVLKAYEESFTSLLYEAATESRADAEFTRWMPWCHENYAIEESRAFVEKIAENWRHRDEIWRHEMEFCYAIFDAESDRFLGTIALNQPNESHKFYNLGYWIRSSAQKRGIASRATRALARAAFEDLPVNRIEILSPVANVASQKTAERSGARREGILRNRLLIAGKPHAAVVFSFVPDDFTD